MSFWRPDGPPGIRVTACDRRLPASWGDSRWMDLERHRTTLELFRPLNEITGPTLNLSVSLAADVDVPWSVVYSSHARLGRLFRGLEDIMENFMVPSAGKGRGLPQAAMSALGETCERLLAMYTTFSLRDTGRLRYATYRELTAKGELATPPEWFRFYGDQQYADPRFPRQAPRADMAIGWVQGTRMISGDKIWIPAQVATCAYPLFKGEPVFGFTSSVGLAAGFSLREATVHSLYEWIERDALNVRWGLRFFPARITGVPWDEVVPELRGSPMLDNPAFELTAMDWSLDVPGIQVLATHVVNRRMGAFTYQAGMAANPDPREALVGALGEVAQVFRLVPAIHLMYRAGRLPSYLRVRRDSPVEEIDNLFKTLIYYGYPENRERLWKNFFAHGPEIPWDEYVARSKGPVPRTYDERYDGLAASFRQRGWDPIVVDLTPPDLPHAKVLKTWVPEMVPYTIVHMMTGHPRYEQIRRDFHLGDGGPLAHEDFNREPIPYP